MELGIYKMDQGGLGNFEVLAETIFVASMSEPGGATLCSEIHPSRARVLPKMHTPQSGLTVRSLSHHLGYCPGSDMHPNWYSLAARRRLHCLNLMLVPWPMIVEPSQFQPTSKRRVTDEVEDGGYGLFTFRPDAGPTVERVRALLLDAERRLGPIDGIVFPELAMSETEFGNIAAEFATPDRFVISGVGVPGGVTAGRNEALFEIVNDQLTDPLGQPVHIRIPKRSITDGSSTSRRLCNMGSEPPCIHWRAGGNISSSVNGRYRSWRCDLG